jgi:hypothetical protein
MLIEDRIPVVLSVALRPMSEDGQASELLNPEDMLRTLKGLALLTQTESSHKDILYSVPPA